MRLLLYAAMAASLGLSAQSKPPVAPSKPPVQTRPRPRPRTPAALAIVIRNQSGTPLPDVRIVVSGEGSKEAKTDANGSASIAAIHDGEYRLRFERDGFVTLERDVTVKNGQPSGIEVVLNPAPPPPPPPEPTPTPAPQAGPSGPPVNVSIPDFLDKNSIGRDPLKESVLGCTGDSTTRVLQIRDALAVHTHAALDEVIYIVAGEGTVRLGGQASAISAGSLAVIPRGVPHALERRGRNPLTVLSMLAGAPCQAAPASSGRNQR
jgi:mannose-6-phosphate isomerase-like protein (cupin superfamily)